MQRAFKDLNKWKIQEAWNDKLDERVLFFSKDRSQLVQGMLKLNHQERKNFKK